MGDDATVIAGTQTSSLKAIWIPHLPLILLNSSLEDLCPLLFLLRSYPYASGSLSASPKLTKRLPSCSLANVCFPVPSINQSLAPLSSTLLLNQILP